MAALLAACGSADVEEERSADRPSSTSTSTVPASPTTSGSTTTSTTATGPAEIGEPTVPTTEAPSRPTGSPATVAIPSIGVDAPVVDLGRNPDGTLEVPDWQDAGWWERGPEAGARGPAVIVGHVDSKDGPAVFYRLSELQPGDLVEVGLDGGGSVQYRVDRSMRFPKDEFPTREVYGLTPGSELRLITCDGEFDASTGHYVDNLVVFATAT